jgi:hypothetical protein
MSAITGSPHPCEALNDPGRPRHHWRLFAPLRDDVFCFFSSRSFLAPPFHAPALLTKKTGAESFKACRARQSLNNTSLAVKDSETEKGNRGQARIQNYHHRIGEAVQYCSLSMFNRPLRF